MLAYDCRVKRNLVPGVLLCFGMFWGVLLCKHPFQGTS